MKTKTRYIFVITIIIPLLLGSCSSVSVTNAPVTPTTTITATTAPTITPTITFTPTATLDPNAPAGTRGTDGQGEFITMENGDITRKVEYKTASGEILWSGWAVEKTQAGGIPLFDALHFNLIPTKLYVSPDVAGGYNLKSLTHPDNTEPFTTSDSLDSMVTPELYTRLHVDLTNNTETNDLSHRLRSGGVPLPLITSTGESVEMLLGPETGFITLVVPYDSLTPTDGNGVSEWIDVRSGMRFRSTMLGVDASGNAIGLIASEKPLNELPDNTVRLLVLFHAASIIAIESQEIQGYSVILDLFVQYADAKGDKLIPDIIVERNP